VALHSKKAAGWSLAGKVRNMMTFSGDGQLGRSWKLLLPKIAIRVNNSILTLTVPCVVCLSGLEESITLSLCSELEVLLKLLLP